VKVERPEVVRVVRFRVLKVPEGFGLQQTREDDEEEEKEIRRVCRRKGAWCRNADTKKSTGNHENERNNTGKLVVEVFGGGWKMKRANREKESQELLKDKQTHKTRVFVVCPFSSVLLSSSSSLSLTWWPSPPGRSPSPPRGAESCARSSSCRTRAGEGRVL